MVVKMTEICVDGMKSITAWFIVFSVLNKKEMLMMTAKYGRQSWEIKKDVKALFTKA